MPRATKSNATNDAPKVPLRNQILKVADELFYRDGIHVTGVDTIIAKSGVAKTTLYRYFPSKDDLVVAYLSDRNRDFWECIEAAINQAPDDPTAQLLAIFEWLEELLAKPDCYGCPFLITITEFPALDYPGHQVAVAHKNQMRDLLTELALKAGAAKPKELGAHLLMLLDGAFVERRLYGQSESGTGLKAAATILINSQLK
jgi:AcrR family transcriptional regulator